MVGHAKLHLFNSSLLRFVEALAPITGHLPMHDAVLASAKIPPQDDERRNVDSFERHVARKYEAQIMARDESFLLAESNAEEGGIGVVRLLAATWSTLCPEGKDIIWRHLQLLLLMCRDCCPQEP